MKQRIERTTHGYYAISGCSVGKGNALAGALYEKYRWKIIG